MVEHNEGRLANAASIIRPVENVGFDVLRDWRARLHSLGGLAM